MYGCVRGGAVGQLVYKATVPFARCLCGRLNIDALRVAATTGKKHGCIGRYRQFHKYAHDILRRSAVLVTNKVTEQTIPCVYSGFVTQ